MYNKDEALKNQNELSDLLLSQEYINGIFSREFKRKILQLPEFMNLEDSIKKSKIKVVEDSKNLINFLFKNNNYKESLDLKDIEIEFFDQILSVSISLKFKDPKIKLNIKDSIKYETDLKEYLFEKVLKDINLYMMYVIHI